MKFCSNCGNPVKDSQKFCPECGFSLQDDAQINTDSSPQSAEVSPTVLPVQKKKHAPMGILAFIFSLTLFLSPLGVLLAIIDLLKNKGKKHGFSIAALIIGGLLSRFLFRSIRNTSQRLAASSTQAVTTSSQKPDATTKAASSSKKPNSTPSPTIDAREAFVSACSTVPYQDVERSPELYKGKNIRIEGKVIQVSEGWFDSVTYRIATEKSGNDDIWYVTYTRQSNETRILNGDHVVVYGICDGVETYKSVLGSSVTIPALKAKYFDVTSISAAEPKYSTSIVKFDVKKETYGDNYEYYAIIEIKNIGDCNIKISSSSFDLEDLTGHLLQTDDMSVYSYRDIIRPGETGYLYSSHAIDIKNSTDVENLQIKPVFNAEATFDEPVRYDVFDTSISKGKYGGVGIVGRITNNTQKDNSYLYVRVAYFDAEGKVLGISGTSVTGLDAGKTISFDISGSSMNADFTVTDVATYEVIAED